MDFFRVTIGLERIWFGVRGGHRLTAYPEAAGMTRTGREMCPFRAVFKGGTKPR